MRARYEVWEVSSGRAIVLRRGKVLLAAVDERGTIFSARQARRWLKHHPTRNAVAVPVESEVAA